MWTISINLATDRKLQSGDLCDSKLCSLFLQSFCYTSFLYSYFTEENDPLVFNKFMRAHKCYDIIPNSSKLIVFDTSLLVSAMFYFILYYIILYYMISTGLAS